MLSGKTERSFFIKGYQFPVCARCTGVLIGYILGVIGHFILGTDFIYCLTGCAIMFTDWYIQYLDIKPSTNTRRLITGILGGYGVMGIQIISISIVFKFLYDILIKFGLDYP